jgi:translocator protein
MVKVGWSLLALVFFLLVSFIPSVISVLTMGPGEWYAQLNKPDWTPPGWVISIIWTVLYTFMGIAAWLVWRSAEGYEAGIGHARWALGLFFVQLVVNAVWTPVFFGLQSLSGAFVVLVILWILVLATMLLFFRHCRGAGILFIPYLAWVTFAGVLLWHIWRMNV